MGEVTSIEQRIIEAGIRWPHLEFKRKTHQEASAPCPFCFLANRDGFLIFANGGYWCRKCNTAGWINENDPHPPTQQELLEVRIRELERQTKEHETRLAALEEMARCTDHIAYHDALTDQYREYWFGEGIFDGAIEKFLLGFCSQCPTYPLSPSYTIPIINEGKLENIRHRLVAPDGAGKYRPHRAGLGASLFNADSLETKPSSVIVCEGEKKTIVLDQAGFDAVGICGQRTFKRQWLAQFTGISTVYVTLDPDAMESAHKLAMMFGSRGRVVQTPMKIDDAITRYGASSEDVEAWLRAARPVQ